MLCTRQPNEAVEKPIFAERSARRPAARFRAGFRGRMPLLSGYLPSGGCYSAPNTQIFPRLCTIAYNLHLYIHFCLVAQRESVHPLVRAMFANTGSTTPALRAAQVSPAAALLAVYLRPHLV